MVHIGYNPQILGNGTLTFSLEPESTPSNVISTIFNDGFSRHFCVLYMRSARFVDTAGIFSGTFGHT